MMTIRLGFILVLIVIWGGWGCRARHDRSAIDFDDARPGAAATPAAAWQRKTRAALSGDEQAYRRAIILRSPTGFADAAIRWGFASARLHREVKRRGITGHRVRSAGWDRNETISPSIPDPEISPRERASLLEVRWVIRGREAHAADGRTFDGTGGDISVERVDGRWVVIVADPAEGTTALKYAYAKDWTVLAEAIDATTAEIERGTLRTIREINDHFEGQRRRRAP